MVQKKGNRHMNIARLKITLDDVQPKVLRRVEVPFDLRLDRLHLVIQAAMGWTNSHLYEFRIGDIGWSMPNAFFPDDGRDARKETLEGLLTDFGRRKFQYTYDFGDSWEHTIALEKITEAVPGHIYPCLLDATGNCPPEDVGGFPGYEELLAVKADPSHERREEFAEWMDIDGFDPNAADIPSITRALNALAKKWARKPKTPKPSPRASA